MDSDKSLFPKEGLWPWWIIGLTLLIYSGSLSNGFIWDDESYIALNPFLTSLKGLKEFWTFSNPFSAFPLTASGFWLQHKLWGIHPWGYHTASLTLHILNSLLLFTFLRRLVPSALAGITSLLFAIHPIQVESVAWIAEQKNLLSFFFFILTCHAFLDFDSKHQKKDYAKALVFFIAALFSKCITVCFAVVPLLYGWWRRGSISKRDALHALPFFLIGALGILMPLYNETVGSSSHVENFSFAERILLAGKNFFFYIKQLLFPWQFLPLYPKWDLQVTSLRNWLIPAAVIAFYTVLYGQRRLGRGAFALLCFYGISIFPALGFFRLSLFYFTQASDHFVYLSAPAILLLACASIRALFSRIKEVRLLRKFPAPSSFFKKSLAVIGISYLCIASFRLTFNYKNFETFWNQYFQDCPRSFYAYRVFGHTCLDRPDLCPTEIAIAFLEKALELAPGDIPIRSLAAAAYERKGLYEKAKQTYLKIIPKEKVSVQAHHYREIGRICMKQKIPKEAIFYLEKFESLRSHPDYIKQRQWYLSMEGQRDVSQEDSEDSLLGTAYFMTGDYSKAAAAFRRATAADPTQDWNYQGLGASLMNQGDIAGALKAFQEAYRLNPENEGAKNNLQNAQRALAGRTDAIVPQSQ